MLKIESILLTDVDRNLSYLIPKDRLEFFTLIGGTNANLITTKVWNQHGTSYLDSFMESFDGELIFILDTWEKSTIEIEEMRRDVVNVCNPLNGILQMKITLNSGRIYNQDIVLTSAPHFPIGFLNRNKRWQKAQIQYTATNPFYYSDTEIIEDFKGVEGIFTFPFSMSLLNPVIFGNVKGNNIATNNGQVESPIIIKITGDCTNPRIDNITTGEFIKFNDLVMTTNDVLEINTAFGQKKVTLNGLNIFNKLDFSSTFFNLDIGDNEIHFDDDSGSPNATISFIYRNLYITL
jgi:hypothetical protein